MSFVGGDAPKGQAKGQDCVAQQLEVRRVSWAHVGGSGAFDIVNAVEGGSSVATSRLG
jgi:hypothetical protein